MRSLRALALSFCAVFLAPAPTSAQAQDAWIAEPEGYRLEDFRAPVPDSLSGASVLTTKEAHRHFKAGSAIFIDVLPRPPKPAGLPEGTIWRPRPRHNIPGSVWLPNTGFGALAPETEAYLIGNLERLTQGEKTRPLLFYCLADCWMSWNVAKRALTYGYSEIYWYPEGTDGWKAAGFPLEKSEPVPLSD